MDVVVTGASGFLGQALLRRLRADGVRAVGVARRAAPSVNVVARYEDAPEGEVLVHLAQQSDRTRINEDPAGEPERAVMLTRALVATGYQHVVFASSAALYCDRRAAPHGADDATTAHDAYTRMKRESEQVVLGTGRGTVARIANVYGPSMSPNNVVRRIVEQVPGVGALRVRDGAPVRDFTWIDDVAAALAAMVVGPPRQVLNVGTGVGTSIRALARVALVAAGEGARAIEETDPSGAASSVVLDITATTAVLGWSPRMSLAAGISQLITRERVQA